MSRKRAFIAGLFSVVYPGLGHIYLREWLRAIGWFAAAFATALLVIPESAVAAYEAGGVAALFEASGTLPTGALLALFTIRALNVIDAAWLGLRSGARSVDPREGDTCPHCGGELDEDLEFCPWCSTRLTSPTDGDEAGATGKGWL